jgi:hypothetical protein
LDTKEVLAKIGKAACSVLADAFIQRSTNAELVAATKSKYQKRTRQHYSQARVMNMEVVREREAKAAEKAIEIAWRDLAKITPNLFEEPFKKSPIKPRVLGYRNTRAFTTAVKPLLRLSPSLFLDRKAPAPDMIMSQQSPSKLHTKSPIKSKARSVSPKKISPQKLRRRASPVKVVLDNAVQQLTVSRSGRLHKAKVYWEQM